MALPIDAQSSSKFVRSKNQVSADLNGNAVVFNFVDGKYFSLNGIGTRVWCMIERPVSLQSMIHCIMNEYDVDEKQCSQDLVRLLNSLYQSGLIELCVEAD